MKNMKLSMKLGVGFGTMVVLIGLVVGIYHTTVGNVKTGFETVIHREIEIALKAWALKDQMLQCRRNEKDFFLRLDDKYYDANKKTIQELNATANEILPLAEAAKLSEVTRIVRTIVEKAGVYESTFDNVHTSWIEKGLNQDSGVYGEFRGVTHELEAEFAKLKDDHAEMLLLMIRRHEKDYMLRGDAKYVDQNKQSVAELLSYVNGKYGGAEAAAINEKAALYSEKFGRLVSIDGRIADETEKMRAAVHEIEVAVDEIEVAAMTAEDESVVAIAKTTAAKALLALIIGVSTCGIGIALAIVISRSITMPLNRIVESLSEGSSQVAAASNQVSSSSQQLAEGAAEQASSLEEISSSLEEMSSMTSSNAENAGIANQTMDKAESVVKEAGASLGELTASIEEIQANSKETGKIIKSIDEIAFQTNLLALNAAVEAARAGEAGKGFAVVAEEVRNLAQRAGEAARNTSSLIESTISSVQGGVELSKKANEKFSEQATYAQKVAQLLTEIAASSKEQAQGIVQVSTGVSQMDKVTQQTASNAEESASAAEEMSSQSGVLMDIVEQLSEMVHGVGSARVKTKVVNKARSGRAVGAGHHVLERKAGGTAVMTRKKPVGHSADRVIPFDDDKEDFMDF